MRRRAHAERQERTPSFSPAGAAGTGHPPTILVVADDRDIGLRRALEREGYQVEWVADGPAAMQLASDTPVDLVVLDLHLPGGDGLEVCQQLRQAFPALAIVILGIRTEEVDTVVALDAGADDYLTKPLRLAEFLARLRAHLRRPRPGTAADHLSAGDVEIDLGARRVRVAGHEIALRPKELDLLALLASEPGRAIGRDRIMERVWGMQLSGSTKTLDMHVSSLRRKLSQAGSRTQITTIRGAGYRFDP